MLSGCADSGPALLPVKAVAAGVASLAPFFDENAGLGRDQRNLRSRAPHSGLQQGNAPGLYGGTRKRPKICDVGKLESFLTDPKHRKKAQVWAGLAGVKVDGIGDYLDGLTPVLLRHDTLVRNHDYQKGEGVGFDALLEAGIAVLVDEHGLPTVKCSCGNPLRAFDDDPRRIDVRFDNGNDKWDGYDKSALVVVKPAPERLKEVRLVDVEDPDQGIGRDVGTAGESDETFDARERRTVPEVEGKSFGEASAALADRGLAAVAEGDEMPPSDAVVSGSSPGQGTSLEFGDAVTLTVDRTPSESSQSDGGTGPGGDSGGSGSPPRSTPPGSPSKPTPTPTPTPPPTPTPTPTPPSPSPIAPTPTPESATPTPIPTTSSASPPPPEPTSTKDGDPPAAPKVDPTTGDPAPAGGSPSEEPGDPRDPGGGPGGDAKDPVDAPARPVWI